MDLGSTATSIYRLKSQAAYEAFDDGALMLRLTDRHIFELNSTSQYVLARTDGQRTAAQIAADMADEFEVRHNEALGDILALYDHLVSERLIEICNFPETSDEG